MAINWKQNNKKKGRTRAGIYLGSFFATALLMIALIMAGRYCCSRNFASSTLWDMADYTYRNDSNYANDVVEIFHDLVHDTLYQKGYHFQDASDTSLLLKRVENLSKKKGIYVFQHLNFDMANQIAVKGDKQDGINVSQFGIDYTLYDLGNRYANEKANSFVINASGFGNVPSGKRETRLCLVTYKDGTSELKDLMVGDYKFWEKNYNRTTKMTGGYQYSYVGYDTADYDYDYVLQGDDSLTSGTMTSDRVPDKVVVLDQTGRDSSKKLSEASCYYFTDKDKTTKAQADMTYVKIVGSHAEDVTDRTNISLQEMYHSVYALADCVPEKTPLLFLSGRNYGGTYFRGNDTYTRLYRQRYGEETARYPVSPEVRKMYKTAYTDGTVLEFQYTGMEKKQVIPAGLSSSDFAVGLFADQNSSVLNVDSPFFKYEATAFFIRLLFNLLPFLLLLEVFQLARYCMVKKGTGAERYLKMGALTFLPVELRVVLFVLLLFGTGQSIYAWIAGESQRVWLGSLLAVLLFFTTCTACLMKKGKTFVFSHSLIRFFASRQADGMMKKSQYYRPLGMGYYLQRQVVIFVLTVGSCLLVMIIVGIFSPYLPKYQFSMVLLERTYMVSIWVFVAVAAGVILCVELICYLRFLRNFIAGINGIQHQLELMSSGDFETKVVLPEKFYGFQAEEQFEAIKGGMMHAMEEMMRSERMKIELVSNVSHDIKTPLTSIINYVDLLADSKDLPAVEADYVKILKRKSYRLKNMIQDLFELSKASSGNLTTQFQLLDLSKLVLQTLADMQEEIDKTTLDFKVHVQENVPVYSDGGRLYRVLQNLILNALKYSMENSRVYVELTRDEEQACFTIKNMSKEELNFTKEQVMERFFRGDASRSTEGSGLGVAIANSFTEVCGGSFDIEINADLFCAKIIMPIYEKHAMIEGIEEK